MQLASRRRSNTAWSGGRRSRVFLLASPLQVSSVFIRHSSLVEISKPVAMICHPVEIRSESRGTSKQSKACIPAADEKAQASPSATTKPLNLCVYNLCLLDKAHRHQRDSERIVGIIAEGSFEG